MKKPWWAHKNANNPAESKAIPEGAGAEPPLTGKGNFSPFPHLSAMGDPTAEIVAAQLRRAQRHPQSAALRSILAENVERLAAAI